MNEQGHDIFETVRSDLGELLVRLKYRGDQSVAPEIIATAVRFLEPHRHVFDRIIPVPPSTARAIQPVIILANGIGNALGVRVIDCITTTRETTQLKDITSLQRREELLDGLHAVDPIHTEGGNILLFDDLFRSGATMNALRRDNDPGQGLGSRHPFGFRLLAVIEKLKVVSATINYVYPGSPRRRRSHLDNKITPDP